MTDKDPLDPFFEAARAQRPAPSDDLLARVMADAEAAATARVPVEQVDSRTGVLVRLKEALGGWPGLAGLTAAAAAGVWIGVAVPDIGALSLPSWSDAEGYDLTDLLPGYGAVAFEEG